MHTVLQRSQSYAYTLSATHPDLESRHSFRRPCLEYCTPHNLKDSKIPTCSSYCSSPSCLALSKPFPSSPRTSTVAHQVCIQPLFPSDSQHTYRLVISPLIQFYPPGPSVQCHSETRYGSWGLACQVCGQHDDPATRRAAEQYASRIPPILRRQLHHVLS